MADREEVGAEEASSEVPGAQELHAENAGLPDLTNSSPEADCRQEMAWRWAADLAVVAVLAWWGIWLALSTGGRDPGVNIVTSVLLLVAIVVTRPWRVLPNYILVWATVTAVGAVVVGMVAPTGMRGAPDAALYIMAAATFLVIAAWARTRARLLVVIYAVFGASLVQMAVGTFAWMGAGDTTTTMVGSFYFFNTFAGFLIPCALLGAGAGLSDDQAVRVAGIVIAAISFAGMIYAKSRASILITIALFLVLAVVAAVRYRWGGVVRAVFIAALSAAVVWLLSSPLLYRLQAGVDVRDLTGGSGAAGVGGSGNVLEKAAPVGNAMARWDYTMDALWVFAHWPLAGTGFYGWRYAVEQGGGQLNTNIVHNGFAQALSDGGIVLGIPFVAAWTLIGLWAVVLVWRGASRKSGLLARAVQEAAASGDEDARSEPSEPSKSVEHHLTSAGLSGVGGSAKGRVRGVAAQFVASPRGDMLAAGVGAAVLGAMAHSAFDFDWVYPAAFMLAAIMAGLAVRYRPARQPGRRLGMAPRIVFVVAWCGLLGFAAWATRNGYGLFSVIFET